MWGVCFWSRDLRRGYTNPPGGFAFGSPERMTSQPIERDGTSSGGSGTLSENGNAPNSIGIMVYKDYL